MRISGLPPIRPSDLKATGKKRVRFSVPSDEASASATGALQALTSVDMLLAMAAVDEETERRRQMAAPAEAGLDALEALDHADHPEERRQRAEALAEWTQSVEAPTDPVLARIQRQIELRALIEIAKAERDR